MILPSHWWRGRERDLLPAKQIWRTESLWIWPQRATRGRGRRCCRRTLPHRRRCRWACRTWRGCLRARDRRGRWRRSCWSVSPSPSEWRGSFWKRNCLLDQWFPTWEIKKSQWTSQIFIILGFNQDCHWKCLHTKSHASFCFVFWEEKGREPLN